MTKEEKAKAYDEALKRAKKILCNINEYSNSCRDIETIFPQLAENEDEKTRKEMIDFLNQYKEDGLRGVDITPWIAYLEKQKEQKPNIELIQRSWYMEGYYDGKFGREPIWLIKTGEDGPKYELNPKYGHPLEENSNPVGWSDEDEVYLQDALWCVKQASKVARGENDMGACWSAERWLKSLPKRFNLEPKQEWGEEDEKIRKALCELFKGYPLYGLRRDDILSDIRIVDILDWLEKQKEQKPAKWSEEDAKVLNDIVVFVSGYADKRVVSRWVEFLKSLRPKKNISYGELPLVSIDYMEGLDTDFEKQVGAVIASAMNREHQFTSKYIKWTAQQLMEYAKGKQNSEEECAFDNKEWSEDDENIRKWCISHFKECFRVSKDNLEYRQYLNDKIIPWFEKQKPLKWNEKDEKMKESIIKALYGGGHFAYEPEITWLKSLRPQPHTVSIKDATKFGNLEYERGVKDGIQSEKKRCWKPNEEQMEALLNIEGDLRAFQYNDKAKIIAELYEQLKKLI